MLNKYIKALVPLAITGSLVACGSSSSDDPVVQADPTTDTSTDTDTSTGTGTDTGTDTGIDTDTGTDTDTDTDTDTETTSNDTELESASRVDIPRYEQLVEDVRAVVNAAEFNADNHTSAIAAIAESSEAQIVFDQMSFMYLLERQIVAGESPLESVGIDDPSLSSTASNFDRAHLCPDGGSLLALKVDLPDDEYSSEKYSFTECQIGGILIDGGYETQIFLSDSNLTIDVTPRLLITGVDGVSTTVGGSFRNDVELTDATSSGNTFASNTLLNTTTTVTVPSGVVLTMEVATLSTETAGADNASVTDVLPAGAYTVSVSNVTVTVDDEETGNTRLSGSTTTSTVFSQTPEGSTFEQGELEIYMAPTSNVLTIQADNGDPTSFDAFITQADNSVTSYVIPWDSGNYELGPKGERVPIILPAVTE